MENFAELCEAVMIICFGLSWPMNIIKAYRARTAKGTSILFMFFIWLGYVGGITSKIVMMCIDKFSGTWTAWLGFTFYIINILMVSTGMIIYFRNKKLDTQNK